jgi:uncharacterized protein
MKKIWFDITNTPQVHFLTSIGRALDHSMDVDSFYTARDFSETIKLLEKKIDAPFQVIGGHHGKSMTRKIAGLLSRFKEIAITVPKFDVSISCGSESAVWSSFLRGKQSIAFGDNDQARQWTYGHLVDFAFFPDAVPYDVLARQGLKSRKLYRYPGYKEDVYLADYEPDDSFKQFVPFDHYVVVRPENIMANYIRNDSARSITPELLSLLDTKGINVLYLPRYAFDRAYADGFDNIFIPDGPVNGLDACYFADAVLTGAGTFAREAACLGVPSFSFYAGKDMLAVDKKMIADKWMFFSRDPSELVTEVVRSHRKQNDLNRSKAVRNDIIHRLKQIISTRA